MPTATMGPQRRVRRGGAAGGRGADSGRRVATIGAATTVVGISVATAVMAAPASGRPRSKRRRSTRRSWADWYRASTFFAIAVSTM